MSLREQARAAQRAKEDALGDEGRIRLALTLGLRAKALRGLGVDDGLDKQLDRVPADLAPPEDDEPVP